MKKLLLPFFFICNIAMMVVMNKTGATLKTAATPHGIINLEFAYNNVKTNAIINAWAPINEIDNIAVAKINTWFDFLFICAYAFFFFFACTKIAGNIKGTLSKVGNNIAKAALLAGFFDVLENAGMLLTLNGYVNSSVAFLTTFFSVLKWGLVLLVVLYLLIALLVLAYQKLNK